MARLLFLVAASLLPGTGVGDETAAPELPFSPRDGETVVFLGDSITHQSLYTQYLENFFLTRHPERRIRFHNAGVSGDKAADCLARFDEDVAGLDPDYVFVLLGMNDGQYEPFRAETVATYEENVGILLDRIAETGARGILLSPTMFDHATAARRANDETWRFRERDFSPSYNALMAYFGAWCLEEAGRRNLAFVNLWGPLNEHTIARRRIDPDFSLVEDAIHPQASGQFVMAFEILSQLGVEKKSADTISITRRGNQWVGRMVDDISGGEDGASLSFRHTASSLPWVIPEKEASRDLKWGLPSDGRIGYAITRAGHKLSADRLKITGLAPGTYEVTIDGRIIGEWNHIALGTRVELQENENTPQFQQALEVALMNQRRNDEIVRPLRDLWSRIKGIRRGGEQRADELPTEIEKAGALAQKAMESLSEIYTAAVPREHHWTIRKVE